MKGSVHNLTSPLHFLMKGEPGLQKLPGVGNFLALEAYNRD